MTLFEGYLEGQLKAERVDAAITVAVAATGAPVLQGLDTSVVLNADTAASVGVDHAMAPLRPLLRRLWHAWQICADLPHWSEVRVAAPTATVYGGAFTVSVTVETASGAVTSDVQLAGGDLLDLPPDVFHEWLSAWQERRGRIVRPVDLSLDPPGNDAEPDPSWALFAAPLALDAAAVAARVAVGVAWADALFHAVEAKYRAIYGLPLPHGLADFAALVDALGALPAGKGWDDGWLSDAVSVSPGGITAWFMPGGLSRETVEASAAYGADKMPLGADGPLDPRLDVRFRCDAPQFVTIAWGDSDGLHWGLWYDSPDDYPAIAHNYARDSAETARDDDELLPWLAQRCADQLDESRNEVVQGGEYFHYALARLRAIRVVGLHLEALQALRKQTPARDEPHCPWPRADAPTGSPPLALPPGSGGRRAPRRQRTRDESREADYRAEIAEARNELALGRPALALHVGLELHWQDWDPLRDEGGALLRDAYLALGWKPFADILEVHVRHRDLPSVSVFKAEPWPPEPPTSAQIQAASGPLAVAWDRVAPRLDDDTVPDRSAAHARARRLGLDWGDPVARAVATWGTDDDPLDALLTRG